MQQKKWWETLYSNATKIVILEIKINCVPKLNLLMYLIYSISVTSTYRNQTCGKFNLPSAKAWLKSDLRKLINGKLHWRNIYITGEVVVKNPKYHKSKRGEKIFSHAMIILCKYELNCPATHSIENLKFKVQNHKELT